MAVQFPFSAIVGQDEMKLAILLAAVDWRIGGVLVFGDRGTGKSTAVRALAALLPKMRVVAGCPYGCDPAAPSGCEACEAQGRAAGAARKSVLVPVPVVDLPLGATEDRVVGALDLERALSQGVKAFEPGLLARANRGFLYVDEVNLLEDHLVDLLIEDEIGEQAERSREDRELDGERTLGGLRGGGLVAHGQARCIAARTAAAVSCATGRARSAPSAMTRCTMPGSFSSSARRSR